MESISDGSYKNLPLPEVHYPISINRSDSTFDRFEDINGKEFLNKSVMMNAIDLLQNYPTRVDFDYFLLNRDLRERIELYHYCLILWQH
jgi:hypothetical protein